MTDHCPTCGAAVRIEASGTTHYMVPIADERIQVLEAENVRLGKRHDILAMYMAEVKAIADGCHKNTLGDVVEHCLEALKELPR